MSEVICSPAMPLDANTISATTVSVPVATETQLGVGYVATDAEVEGGITNKEIHPCGPAFVTPEQVWEAVNTDVWSETFITETQYWIVPATGRYCIWCQGAGGGGGGSTGKTYSAGAGGNSGETRRCVVRLKQSEVIHITIGNGGSGGIGVIAKTDSDASGSSGEKTTFGSYCGAVGGFGGRGWNENDSNFINMAPSYTQSLTNGKYVSFLQPGNGAQIVATGDGEVKTINSGAGGNSLFGQGGQSIHANPFLPSSPGSDGLNGSGYGAGGSGCAKLSGAGNGGAGSPGCVLIERIA